MEGLQEKTGIRGMFRLQIEEPTGEIVGDSGWQENLITNLGFNQYLVSNLGTTLTGSKISHVALGTGTAPGAADTTLNGEQSVRAAVTAATSSDSKTLNMVATFASAASFVTATKAISNIGLFATSTAGGGTLFAGTTYAVSTVATNQNVNVTYNIVFSS
jgi:hypothetical protein